MIRPAELDGIRAGRLDLAFRRWDRPRVLVGTRLRTRIGLVEVTGLDRVDPAGLTDHDARRAGMSSAAALRDQLSARAERPVWRIAVRYAGPDPRVVLREQRPSAEEIAQIRRRLDRLDRAAAYGAWTAATLELIDAHPERRAPELAADLGRETAPFKRDVRKLKELGLTESLDIGYRLSPRGEVVVDAARRAAGRPARRRPTRPDGTPLPGGVGASATRALRTDGLTTLEEVAARSETELRALHGVGPVAIERLRRALGEAGLQPWKSEST